MRKKRGINGAFFVLSVSLISRRVACLGGGGERWCFLVLNDISVSSGSASLLCRVPFLVVLAIWVVYFTACFFLSPVLLFISLIEYLFLFAMIYCPDPGASFSFFVGFFIMVIKSVDSVTSQLNLHFSLSCLLCLRLASDDCFEVIGEFTPW